MHSQNMRSSVIDLNQLMTSDMTLEDFHRRLLSEEQLPVTDLKNGTLSLKLCLYACTIAVSLSTFSLLFFCQKKIDRFIQDSTDSDVGLPSGK